LPWDERVLRFHEHAAEREVKMPRYSAVASPIYQQSVAWWRNYETQIELLMMIRQPFIGVLGYGGEDA